MTLDRPASSRCHDVIARLTGPGETVVITSEN